LTRSIAVDYAPNIRCVAICPGSVDTPMLQDSIAQTTNPEEVLQDCHNMHLTQRIGKPEEIGELVAFVASEKGSFMTGQGIRVDGGMGVTISSIKEAG
jgi:NAD(P)-dependent dehydrogenase (short-subunit alcohol dehydrogenase family)